LSPAAVQQGSRLGPLVVRKHARPERLFIGRELTVPCAGADAAK